MRRIGTRKPPLACGSQLALVTALGVLVLCWCLPSAAAASSPWSAPIHFYTPESPGFAIADGSCASASFCAAVDNENDAMTYDGNSWSGQVNITGTTGIGPTSVSCPSSSFCVAGDTNGRVITYDGSSWSSPNYVGKDHYAIIAVSCSSSAFCVALDQRSYAIVYNGSSWSSPVHVLPSYGESIACPSSAFCVAGDSAGSVAYYNGSSWNASIKIDGSAQIRSLSCASPSSCMAVTEEGDALVYNGGLWSTPVSISSGWLYSAACVPSMSRLSCAAAGINGNVYMYDGSVWSNFAGVDSHGDIVSVSCPSNVFCMTVDRDGYYSVYTGPPVPENVRSPEITGSMVQGQTLNEVHGEWLNGPTSYDYQWERCDSSGNSCEAIGGAVFSTYSLGVADIGYTIKVTEVARNFTGVGSPATSEPTAIVQAEPEQIVELPTEPPPPPPPPTSPKARITSHPPSETADRDAPFTFTGERGGTYECSVDAGPWRSCRSGEDFGPLLPGDHRFRVRESLNGLTGPADSYSWTIDLPRACVLRVARARVFVFTHQHRVRLVIHYKTYRPAKVTVAYKLLGRRGGLKLGKAASHFKTAGIFRLSERLDKRAIAKVRATRLMKVAFRIPRTPHSCGRYYAKRLTIPKKVFGQTVWFQSDSIFTS